MHEIAFGLRVKDIYKSLFFIHVLPVVFNIYALFSSRCNTLQPSCAIYISRQPMHFGLLNGIGTLQTGLFSESQQVGLYYFLQFLCCFFHFVFHLSSLLLFEIKFECSVRFIGTKTKYILAAWKSDKDYIFRYD